MEINICNNPVIEAIKVNQINCDTIEIFYHEEVEIEESDIMASLREIDHLASNHKLKHLVIFNEFSKISISAVKLLGFENQKRKNKIIGEAIVINSISVRLILDIYINKFNHNHLVKVFKNETDAKNWLNGL